VIAAASGVQKHLDYHETVKRLEKEILKPIPSSSVGCQCLSDPSAIGIVVSFCLGLLSLAICYSSSDPESKKDRLICVATSIFFVTVPPSIIVLFCLGLNIRKRILLLEDNREINRMNREVQRLIEVIPDTRDPVAVEVLEQVAPYLSDREVCVMNYRQLNVCRLADPRRKIPVCQYSLLLRLERLTNSRDILKSFFSKYFQEKFRVDRTVLERFLQTVKEQDLNEGIASFVKSYVKGHWGMDLESAQIHEVLSRVRSGDSLEWAFCQSVPHDVAFHVGEREVTAVKSRVTEKSPVFERMFDSGMREHAENAVEIVDADPKIFRLFVEILMGKDVRVDPKLGADLYPLADKYEVRELATRCFFAAHPAERSSF
jgi:hypothetical protein